MMWNLPAMGISFVSFCFSFILGAGLFSCMHACSTCKSAVCMHMASGMLLALTPFSVL